MTEQNNRLKLSCLSALFGHVPACLRSFSLRQISGIIKLWAILDKEVTANDFELLSMAARKLIVEFNE